MIIHAFDFEVNAELKHYTKLKYSGSLRLEHAYAKFTLLSQKQEEKIDATLQHNKKKQTTILNAFGISS